MTAKQSWCGCAQGQSTVVTGRQRTLPSVRTRSFPESTATSGRSVRTERGAANGEAEPAGTKRGGWPGGRTGSAELTHLWSGAGAGSGSGAGLPPGPARSRAAAAGSAPEPRSAALLPAPSTRSARSACLQPARRAVWLRRRSGSRARAPAGGGAEHSGLAAKPTVNARMRGGPRFETFALFLR